MKCNYGLFNVYAYGTCITFEHLTVVFIFRLKYWRMMHVIFVKIHVVVSFLLPKTLHTCWSCERIHQNNTLLLWFKDKDRLVVKLLINQRCFQLSEMDFFCILKQMKLFILNIFYNYLIASGKKLLFHSNNFYLTH